MLLRILLSTLILFQFSLCGDVPEQLRHIYGDINPCHNPILNSSIDKIKDMDEREFEYYKMEGEKCENYRKALIEIEQTEANKKSPK